MPKAFVLSPKEFVVHASISHSPVPSFLPPGSFARYSTLDWDRAAYNDVNEEGRKRKIIRPINRTPESPIQVRHNFQIGTINSSAGNGPTLHAHDYPEIFIPVYASFRVGYGPRGDKSVQIGLYDTFSIPVNVMRLFEANEIAPRESQMLSIFDTDRSDARDGISITSEIAAIDKAQGLDQGYAINDASDDPSPELIEQVHVARFALLPVWPEQGMLVRHVISSANPRARLRTRHTIEVDFLEVPSGSCSDTYSSQCREVFVPIEGVTDLHWNGRAIDMERLDVLTVAPGVERSIQSKGEGRTLMLRIRDTTNLQ